MQTLTEDGQRIVEAVAKRHGISAEAVYQLLLAIAAGNGRQAQFNHPELGGMGQWAQGGMTMIGDMFDQGLKARVGALCTELAGFVQGKPPAEPQGQTQSQNQGAQKRGAGTGSRLFLATAPQVIWPEELGTPSSSGSQNDMHYAVFPHTRRLAIARNGQIAIYDTGDHVIGGLAQQQGTDQSLTVTSQHGLVPLSDLRVVSTGISKGARRSRPAATKAAPTPAPAPAAQESPAAPPPRAAPPALSITVASPPPATPAPAAKPEPIPATSDDEIFSRIERLADLRKKDIITAEEFDAKKTELLARL